MSHRAPNVASRNARAGIGVPCWQTPEPCVVVGRLSAALRDRLANFGGVGDGTSGPRVGEGLLEEALSLVGPLLPCRRCKGVEVAIARLGRLGKLERHVLLGAPPPTVSARIVEPLRPGHAAAVAHRRAVHRLAEAGLVCLSKSRTGWLAIRSSPLGQAIVERLGDALRAGKRVRWSRHRQGLLAAVRRPIPELLDDLRRSVADARQAHLDLIALLAAFRRPADLRKAEDHRLHLLDLVLAAIENVGGARA